MYLQQILESYDIFGVDLGQNIRVEMAFYHWKMFTSYIYQTAQMDVLWM